VVIAAGSLTIGPVFQSLTGNPPLNGTQESHAQNAISVYGNQGDQVIALVDGINARAPGTQATLTRAVTDIRAIARIANVSGPQAASDSRSAAITITTQKAGGDAEHSAVLAAVARLDKLPSQISGATVLYGGGDSINNDANNAVAADLNRGEVVSLPVTLIVMIFIFGGLAAAGLPILAALGTVAGAFAALLGFSTFLDMGHDVITVATLLGLGLSIDYALLLVTRYRDELAAGHEPGDAVSRAWATAGRTVMFSGLTVAVALTGLLVLRVPRLQGMGAAGISVAIVALLAALTLTAGLVGVLERWIKPSRKAVARRAAAASGGLPGEDPEQGFFAGLVRVIQRAPALAALGAIAALVAIALPLAHATVKVVTLDGLPRSIQSVQVADQLASQYGQNQEPSVKVVARTGPGTLDTWAARWASDPEVTAVGKASSLGPDISQLVLSVRGAAQGPGAQALVKRMRAALPAGYQSWVVGAAATLVDLEARIAAGLPWAIAVTAGAMLLLLFLMTGSVLIPLKAIVMNLFSLAATFGVLTAIFQHGWLSGPLHTLTVGGLDPYMIVIVFAFAFALSMDYEVFLLSRIKEQHDSGHDPSASVRLGLQRSGRIITSAALLMLIVFGSFALVAKVGEVKEISLGLFLVVAIDATIVRCLLVPAVMTMLGRAAWWAPGPLRRVHGRFGLDGPEPGGLVRQGPDPEHVRV
jgi:putative drug exporter of the RND superfamily